MLLSNAHVLYFTSYRRVDFSYNVSGHNGILRAYLCMMQSEGNCITETLQHTKGPCLVFPRCKHALIQEKNAVKSYVPGLKDTICTRGSSRSTRLWRMIGTRTISPLTLIAPTLFNSKNPSEASYYSASTVAMIFVERTSRDLIENCTQERIGCLIVSFIRQFFAKGHEVLWFLNA